MEFLVRLLQSNLDLLAQGLWVTTQVCTIAFLVSIIVGLLLCLLDIYVVLLRPLTRLVIAFARNTPIFVQLLWVAYAWFELFGFPRTAFHAAWIALAIQSSGYLAETFRSGLEGIDRGQVEAALCIGMSRARLLVRVLLPQMAIVMAPSILNQLVVLIKCSTIVSIIAVPDLMYQALRLSAQWNEPAGILTAIAAIYIALILVISALARLVAQKQSKLYA